MANFAQIIGALAPAAGAGLGAIGGPVGVGIGASIGGMLGSAAGLFAETPAQPGATGAQKGLLSTAMSNVENIQGQTGVTSAQAGRMQQAASNSRAQELGIINAVQQLGATPLEREQISKAIFSQVQAMNRQVEERIASFDAQTEAQKADRLAKATALAAQQAGEIRMAEAQKVQMEQAMEQSKWNNISNALGASAGLLGDILEYQQLRDDKAKPEMGVTYPNAQTATPSAAAPVTPAAAMPTVNAPQAAPTVSAGTQPFLVNSPTGRPSLDAAVERNMLNMQQADISRETSMNQMNMRSEEVFQNLMQDINRNLNRDQMDALHEQQREDILASLSTGDSYWQ